MNREKLVSDLMNQFRELSMDLIREFLGTKATSIEVDVEKTKVIVSIYPYAYSLYVKSAENPAYRIGYVSGAVIASNELTLEFLKSALHAVKIVLLSRIMK